MLITLIKTIIKFSILTRWQLPSSACFFSSCSSASSSDQRGSLLPSGQSHLSFCILVSLYLYDRIPIGKIQPMWGFEKSMILSFQESRARGPRNHLLRRMLLWGSEQNQVPKLTWVFPWSWTEWATRHSLTPKPGYIIGL